MNWKPALIYRVYHDILWHVLDYKRDEILSCCCRHRWLGRFFCDNLDLTNQIRDVFFSTLIQRLLLLNLVLLMMLKSEVANLEYRHLDWRNGTLPWCFCTSVDDDDDDDAEELEVSSWTGVVCPRSHMSGLSGGSGPAGAPLPVNLSAASQALCQRSIVVSRWHAGLLSSRSFSFLQR